MIVRRNTSILLLLTVATLCISTNARPFKDSPIQTISVPYQRQVVGNQPYAFPSVIGESRNVLVPTRVSMVPNFQLQKGLLAMGSQKGVAVNFADGAYPVYYMPGNANGKFNGKISLLA